MEPIARHLPGQVLCFQYHFGKDEHFSLQNLSNYFAKVRDTGIFVAK